MYTSTPSNISSRPINILQNLNLKKDVINEAISSSLTGRALTPEVKNDNFTPFDAANNNLGNSIDCLNNSSQILKIGRYVIQRESLKGDSCETHSAFNVETLEEKKVKILPVRDYRTILSPYFVSGYHPHVIDIEEIILTKNKCYAFFRKTDENLHFYIRRKQKLKEQEAKVYFRQIVESVRHCHENNIIVREIKLRKFVFTGDDKKHIILNNLEEGLVLEDEGSDHLYNKHGCLAYISPEILYSNDGYSGKAADVWSLGVILYTMLVGQYPFHDNDVGNLFKKIRAGMFVLPDFLSLDVKCLLRNLLRLDPGSRMTAEEILYHPWFSHDEDSAEKLHKSFFGNSSAKTNLSLNDQFVPICSQTVLDLEDLLTTNI